MMDKIDYYYLVEIIHNTISKIKSSPTGCKICWRLTPNVFNHILNLQDDKVGKLNKSLMPKYLLGFEIYIVFNTYKNFIQLEATEKKSSYDGKNVDILFYEEF